MSMLCSCYHLKILNTVLYFTLCILVCFSRCGFSNSVFLLFNIVFLSTRVHHMWISKQQWNNTVEVFGEESGLWSCVTVCRVPL